MEDFLPQSSIFQRIFIAKIVAVGCKVKQLSCQGYHQLSTVSIPVHFDHFEAPNHHFIDEPHGGSLIQALIGLDPLFYTGVIAFLTYPQVLNLL